MSDVLLEQINDDGEITIEGGLVELTDDFRTMAYLCLFGGNEDDDGRDDNRLTWWGNLGETEDTFKYVSETQHLLNVLPATTGNLLRLDDAAARDLQVFIDTGIAKTVTVETSIPAVNTVQFVIAIDGDETATFLENWKAAA